MKRTLPYVVTAVVGAIVMLSLFFGVFPRAQTELDKWVQISTAVACAIGLVNLTHVHTKRISRKEKNWWLSALLLVITFGYLLLGLFAGPTNIVYADIFDVTAVPLGQTFYSLLAFYIVSAAYRAFRAKTRDAMILLIAAFIVLLGRAPLGEYIFPGFGVWTKWIMDIPTTAAMRAVYFGATLGAFITAIGIILGLERPYATSGERS